MMARGGGTQTTAKPLWREVAIPSEHGGWSLTAEPVVLGLIVAWSWSGLFLGLGAMLAFVARTPLKVVLVDRFRRRWLPRSRLAARTVAVEVALILVLGILAVASAGLGLLLPLALAVPLIGIELWFDMRSRSRRLIPELAGTVGVGSVAAAIAIAGGSETILAASLWWVIAARSVAAIPYVRVQLDRIHGRSTRLWESDLAQMVAVVAMLAGWVLTEVPGAAVGALVAIALFNAISVRVRTRPVVVIGVLQMLVGAIVVAATAFPLSG